MKYYLAVLQNPGQESETKSLTDYVNYDDAMALYHTELAYRAEGRVATTCTVFDEQGTPIATESWIRGSSAPEGEIFYVAIIQNQGASEADAIFKFSDWDSALATYHRELGYRDPGSRLSTIVSILGDDGRTLRHEKWVAQSE